MADYFDISQYYNKIEPRKRYYIYYPGSNIDGYSQLAVKVKDHFNIFDIEKYKREKLVKAVHDIFRLCREELDKLPNKDIADINGNKIEKQVAEIRDKAWFYETKYGYEKRKKSYNIPFTDQPVRIVQDHDTTLNTVFWEKGYHPNMDELIDKYNKLQRIENEKAKTAVENFVKNNPDKFKGYIFPNNHIFSKNVE